MSNLFNSKCPKCGKKLSPLHIKQNCPYCDVDLLYYQMDKMLEADAVKAQQEVDALNRFVSVLKNSTVASPLLIIRLVLFFTPLLSMCLPMYFAGSKQISLISVIVGIVNYGFHFDAIVADLSYLFAVLSMVLVILLSLAVIISSLFTATKNGFKRNLIFSIVNTVALIGCGIAVASFGGILKSGFYVTLAIYSVEFLLHFLVTDKKTKSKKLTTAVCIALCLAVGLSAFAMFPKNTDYVECEAVMIDKNDVQVVSFNVAGPWGTWADSTDTNDRCARFSDYMSSLLPDIIGTQEMNQNWMSQLEKSLSDYDSYGVERGGDANQEQSEHNTIYWLKDRFSLVDNGTFWLSDTPDVESKYTYTDDDGVEQQAACNRICSYVILCDNNYANNQRLIAVFNTHLDHVSSQARACGANVIKQKIAEISASYTQDVKVVLTGDFNANIDDEGLLPITTSLNLATADVKTSTYQNWGYSKGIEKPIDFIFTNGSSKSSRVLDYTGNGYISDHYGVYSQISFD